MYGLFADGVLVGAVAEDAGDCAYKALDAYSGIMADDLNGYLQGFPETVALVVANRIARMSTGGIIDELIDDYCSMVQHRAESSADGAYLGLGFSISPVVWDADAEEWKGAEL